MTLEQLRIFAAVAERGHVTAAARALGLSQSAASAAIATLESGHGVKLFHRVGRGIALTEAGAQFLVEARGVLARAAEAEAALRDIGGLRRGHLRLYASQTVAGYWLPRRLVDFRAAHPGIALGVRVGNTAQAAQAVRDGTADLGFVEGTVNDPALQVETVARDRMILAVGAGHPWAGRKRVRAADLLQSRWVLRETGSGTRALFETALASHKMHVGMLEVLLELPSNEAVRAAVETGEAATVLSASVLAAGIEAGLLMAVGFDLPDRALSAVTHRQRSGHAVQAFLDMVRRRRR